MRVAYLCDGQGCASVHPSCRYLPEGDLERCTHTTDPAHAVNGACEHPEEYPERFVEVKPGAFMERSLRKFTV